LTVLALPELTESLCVEPNPPTLEAWGRAEQALIESHRRQAEQEEIEDLDLPTEASKLRIATEKSIADLKVLNERKHDITQDTIAAWDKSLGRLLRVSKAIVGKTGSTKPFGDYGKHQQKDVEINFLIPRKKEKGKQDSRQSMA
jgi:hypothetical protein